MVGEAYDDGSICGERDGEMKFAELFRNSNHARELARHDATLIKVVESLGAAASGQHAALEIEIIKGSRYRIDEYDGRESVQEPDDIEWTEVAP